MLSLKFLSLIKTFSVRNITKSAMNLHGSNNREGFKKNLGQGNNCVPECFLLACLNFLHLLKGDHSKKRVVSYAYSCDAFHITR